MYKVIFILFYFLLSKYHLLSYSEIEPSEYVVGGFAKCSLFTYSYKFGEVDIKSKVLERICIYNKKGKIIEIISFYNGEIQNQINYKYDNNENKIESELYYKIYGSKKMTLSLKTIFRYDDNSKIVEELVYGGDGSLNKKFIYKYDIDLRKKVKIQVAYVQSNEIKFSYFFNKNGHLTDVYEHLYDGSYSKTSYLYDLNNLLFKVIEYNLDGSINKYYNYYYHENGNIKEIIEMAGIDEAYRKYEFIYSKK